MSDLPTTSAPVPPPLPKAGRIPSLDGLRAISVSLVLLGHGSGSIPADHPLLRQTIGWIGQGGVGVMVFFVISGYLITSLLLKERERTGTISIPGFYKRRMLRIFPAFYTFLLVISLLSAFGVIAVAAPAIISAGTFLWNYSHLWHAASVHSSWYVGHFWSLSLEEQFYLLWPLTFLLLGSRRAAVVALVLILIMPEMRLAMYFLDPGSRGQLGMMIHTAIDGIMCGCLLAMWEGKPRFERIFQYLNHGYVALLAAVFVFVLEPYGGGMIRGLDMTFGQWSRNIAITLIVFWCVRNPTGAVGRLLNTRGMVYVGTLSYSIYLWQQLFLTPFPEDRVLPFPFNILLSVVAGMVSYHCIERPFLAYRHRAPAIPAPVAALPPTGTA